MIPTIAAPAPATPGWIGVDLDGTLAEYHGWTAPDVIGAPIPAMVARVRVWIADGLSVRIFTARGSVDAADRASAYPAIAAWCERHLGQALLITDRKDIHMLALWDDRAIGVAPNSGQPVMSLANLAAEVLKINRANGWNCITPDEWASNPYKVPALRVDRLQAAQKYMRDPERKMVCDIIANGTTNQGQAMNTWISCNDKLPSHPAGGTWIIHVLCYVEGFQRPRLLSYFTCSQPFWYDETDNVFSGKVLAWMKLPELPKPEN